MAATTSTATAMVMICEVLIYIRVALELEEDSVTPWEREVEAWTAEERADDHQYRPEHEMDGEEAGHKLAVFWSV